MATAKKLPSGSWRCQVYDYTDEAGKRHYASFAATTRKEAEYQAALFALTKKERSRSDLTFGEALDKYIELRAAVCSPRTIRDYKAIRSAGLAPLADIRIADMTQEGIQRFVNADAVKHSPKTVRCHHGLISAVLKQERPEFALNTKLPAATQPDRHIPSDEEVKKLMEYAAGTELEIPIMLAAFGPMRRGEICALSSDCINGNVVHVKLDMVLNERGEWVIKPPKTFSSDRYIEFPDFVAEKLAGISGRVTDLTPDHITHRFGRLVKRAGLPRFRFHDLRHYSASIQHALGIPDAYIMQRGGWKTDGVLKSVYRHAMDDTKRQMDGVANGHFSELCNTQ